MAFVRRALVSACLAACSTAVFAAPTPSMPSAGNTTVVLSHQLSAGGQQQLQALVDRFNAQNTGRVELAPANKTSPTLLNLVNNSQVATFIANKQAIKPLYKLLAENGLGMNASDLSGNIKADVADSKGRLVALPIAYSTPVMFYNKALFRKAGLDAERAPQTWQELQGALVQVNSVANCAYTSSWPVWVHIDNASIVNGASIASTGKTAQFTFNTFAQVKHLAMLATWSKAGLFQHFGRDAAADEHFANGECAVITTNAAANARFREAPGLEVGMAPLPYSDDAMNGRQNTLAGGASLWIGGNGKPQDYQVAAKFVQFLLSPAQQLDLARFGGFLPLNDGAKAALVSKLARDEEQALNLSYNSLRSQGSNNALRASGTDAIRAIVDEELEALWTDRKPAKAALDSAVSRSNAALKAKPVLRSPFQL